MPDPAAIASTRRIERWALVGLALLTLVGAILRLVALHQTPPGLHYDEAVYGMMAKEITGGHYPIYFPAYTGREPLYMYLMAGVFDLVGVSTYGIRLTSALIGILTLPLIYLLLRQLFSWRVGLLAAAGAALSYWHLTVSRNGYPNILIPPIECLALYFLWKGYRAERLGWMALGGAFVGLILYTYLAARFFPLTVAVFCVYVLAVDRQRSWRRVGGLALAAGAALAVFAPLGLYFLRHPDYFFERANQVLVLRDAHAGEQLRLLAVNLWKTLRGFVYRGDPRWQFNIAKRPVFDYAVAPFFLLGLGLALRRWRRPEYGLLVIGLVGMLTPAILTDSAMPQGQRMFGIIPAIYGLTAVGFDAALGWAKPRLKGAWRALPIVALAGLGVYEGATGARDYFTYWAHQSKTFYTFHSDYALLAERTGEELDAGRTVVIQSLHYKHPTVLFAEPRADRGAIWSVGAKSFALPNRPGADLVYLWPATRTPLQGGILPHWERLLEEVETILDPDGQPAVRILRPRPGALESEAVLPAVARLGDEVEVLGWELPERARRDKALRLVVHWRALKAVEGGRKMTLHLVDGNDVLWAQDSDLGYLPSQWQAGDTAYQLFELEIPAGMPAGRYEARLILADEESAPKPATRDGQPAGAYLTLGQVTFKEDGRRFEPLSERGALLGATLRALQVEGGDLTAVPGGRVQCAVTWQALVKPGKDYRVALELLDGNGLVQLGKEQPLAYEYATTAWEASEVVRAVYSVPLGDLDVGDYRLRLRVLDEPGELAIGAVRIAGARRLYEAPPMQHQRQALFGEVIELVGYALPAAPVAVGQEWPLTLYWRAAAAPRSDYKVFVHLLGADGRLWGQHDSAPADWQRPTSGWVEGEYIVDAHKVAIQPDAPAGEYTLVIGLYDAATLERLPVQADAGLLPEQRLEIEHVIIAR